MSTKFLSPGWRMPRNANQSKQSNYSLDFEGESSSSYIDSNFIPANNLTGNFTISAWVYSDNITGGIGVDFICGVENYTTPRKKFGFGLYNNNSPQYYYMFGSTSAIGATISNNPKNTWTHLTVTYDGANLKFYSNGTLDSTVSVGVLSDYSTSDMYIGARNKVDPTDSATDFFNGKMTELCIFDYDLSSSQVTTLWGGGTSASNPMALPRTPIAYYPLGTSAWNGNFLAENNAIGDYVFDFDGLAEITTGGISGISSNTTVSFWFNNSTAAGGQAPLIASLNYTSTTYENFAFRLQTNNIIQAVLAKSGNYEILETSAIIDNAWYFVVLTTSTSGSSVTATLYLNGTQVATNSGTDFSNLNDLQNGLTIGHWTAPGNQNNFNGTISNVQIFNTALSATEVETLYNYGSPIQTLANIPQNSNLNAWYKLDASEVYDSSNTQWQIANNVLSDKAYSFNGTNNIEITQNSSIQTSNFSIGLWIKGYPQLDKTIIENGGANGFSIKTKHNDATKVLIRTGSVDGLELTGALNGEWNFVYFTMSGNSSRGGLNGGYSYAGGAARNYDSSKGLFIGSKSDSTSGFTGEIAQVVYYDGRGPNNATGLYGNLPANPPPNPLVGEANPNLVSWWKLDAASITDGQGSNNGSNNGATLIDTNVGRPAGIGGLSQGMSQSNLVQSDLQTVAPYSKYALSFDGTNDYIDTNSTFNTLTSFSISAWFKADDTAGVVRSIVSTRDHGLSNSQGLDIYINSNVLTGRVYSNGATEVTQSFTDTTNWHHVALTYNGSTLEFFLDNSSIGTATGSYDNTSGKNLLIGKWGYSSYYFDGSISNVSVWNAALTPTQVREIYNEGLPSNLNSHSAYSNLVSWWQLGSNSSWNGNRWIVADEKGTNNGYSQNMSPYMPESGLTNGVGTTANGTSSGMGVEALVGDAPYSTANAISSGMAATARGTDIPPTP
jgi:hypothetical protein